MSGAQIKQLQEENEELKRKLNLCMHWMTKEVEEEIHKIARRRVSSLTQDDKDEFLRDNQEQIISKRIQNYFGDILLLNAPKETLLYLTNSEINYYNIQKNPNLDGFAVVSSYHKILDSFIEHFITSNFRKFCVKKWKTILRSNDPIEKALNSVVNKKYNLSVWRLFHLLRSIRNDEKMFEYGETFAAYLDKYIEVKDVLLSDSFYKLFAEVITSDVLGWKRHSGKINIKETEKTRKLMVWDYTDKNSILYILLESQSVVY